VCLCTSNNATVPPRTNGAHDLDDVVGAEMQIVLHNSSASTTSTTLSWNNHTYVQRADVDVEREHGTRQREARQRCTPAIICLKHTATTNQLQLTHITQTTQQIDALTCRRVAVGAV
jgi:hypothetical protein